MGTFIAIASRIIIGILRSPEASTVARYAARQATAAIVREIRSRTRRKESGTRIS